MKNVIFSSIIFLTVGFPSSLQAQGKFASPALQKLIGTTFTDNNHISGLEGYAFHEGSLISSLEDEEQFSVYVFSKGASRIVFFTHSEKDQKEAQILDVIELKTVAPGLEIKTALCREYKQENICIVALLKPSTTEYSTDVKQAWFFNRDKIRFESIDPKNVDCLNEGED